jgi:hypothetical protein
MLGLLTRLLRVLWRQDAEGAGQGAVVLPFDSQARGKAAGSVPLPQPVEFIRQAGEVVALVPVTARAAVPAHRPLAAQLQSVARLNAPTSRARARPRLPAAGKPKPVVAVCVLKRQVEAKRGVVLGRLNSGDRDTRAEVVNLSSVRRSKQIELADREIAALFN